MVYVLHGDDTTASRNRLNELRSLFKTHELTMLFGKGATETDIIQLFQSQSLFEEPKLIILEEFIQTKNKSLVSTLLNNMKREVDHEVIFWEPKEIKKELIAFFPKKSAIELFKVKQIIFQFLDSLKPGNAKVALSFYKELLETEEAELVFYMLVRQFRILLAVSIDSNSKIDEVKRLAPWQKGKLEKQALSFGEKRLEALFKKLYGIEVAMKTGGLALPLEKTLDLFLIGL